MKKLKIKLFLVCLLTLALSCSISAQVTHPNFIMWWQFTDATGTNIITNQEVCDCGTVYIKNMSTYNNGLSGGSFGIGASLTTGYYSLYEQYGPWIMDIPAGDWVENQVYAVTLPCGTYITNLRIKHFGSGTSPYATSPSSEHKTNPITIHHVDVYAGVDQTVCAFSAFTLEATGTGSDFNWYPSGGSNNPTLPIWSGSTQTYTVTNSQNYSTSSQGILTCSATDDVVVNIETPPSVSLPDYSLCDSSTMPILNGGLVPTTYQWQFTPTGSSISTVVGSSQTINTALHGYGLYQLTVFGANGCASSAISNVELDPSAGANIDPDFTYTVYNSLSTTTISPSSTESGSHHWMLFSSDASGTTPLYPLEHIYTTSSSHSFSAYPLNNFYKVIHELEKNPCNESAEASKLTYSGSKIGVYPNPVMIQEPFVIELLIPSTEIWDVEISEAQTGRVVYRDQLSHEKPLKTSLNASIYNVSVSRGREVINQKLIVRKS